ncbi:hypothetical protein [Ramlibacter albus]|uniref:Uncharacterized protein n=1 Tax=Ramlibacter albus TaxID=2079448 RepID=A0A923M899_9BURK|nr:hypothetical protein [Ramlibacter albus]MBC5765663.1 hypothetical protein [Ramlibacter albus]
MQRKQMFDAGRPPPVGQLLLDEERRQWRVESVIRSASIQDYFLVRLKRLQEGETADGGMRVLSPTEFASMIRERRLIPFGPEVQPPAP